VGAIGARVCPSEREEEEEGNDGNDVTEEEAKEEGEARENGGGTRRDGAKTNSDSPELARSGVEPSTPRTEKRLLEKGLEALLEEEDSLSRRDSAAILLAITFISRSTLACPVRSALFSIRLSSARSFVASTSPFELNRILPFFLIFFFDLVVSCLDFGFPFLVFRFLFPFLPLIFFRIFFS